MRFDEKIAAFGTPAALKGGVLVPDPRWERTNIVRVTVPWPVSTGSRVIRVHKAVKDKFVALFTAWRDAGVLDRLKTMDGTLNVRMIRGSETSTALAKLSTHSWGAAIDLNAAWNKLGSPGAALGEVGSMAELIPFMAEHGFVSGSTFSRRDDMHGEVGAVQGGTLPGRGCMSKSERRHDRASSDDDDNKGWF